MSTPDWFEKVAGFTETDYDATARRLTVRDGHLVGHAGRAWSMGRLETPTLAELRARAAPLMQGRGRTRVSCVAADVRALHGQADNRHALFQVASQFNLLEMVAPEVTPEHGVTRYQHDFTQGPACAMAAGAGTIYRNYIVPCGGRPGQRADRQIDCLEEVGRALAGRAHDLWDMRNGYVMCTRTQLAAIDDLLRARSGPALDALRAQLRIGLHWDVDVTDLAEPGHRVNQAYCSALPVLYSGLPAELWAPFARLVLEAAYEATLLAAAIQREATGVGRVHLTQLGGGAFGNDTAWIVDAMHRAIGLSLHAGLDVTLVAYGRVPPHLQGLAAAFA